VLARSLSSEAAQARAKAFGLSLTEYLVSLHLGVLQDYRAFLGREKPSHERRPLTVMVPADLRRVFPSASLRNFSGVLLPTLPWTGRPVPFAQIAAQVRATKVSSCSPARCNLNW